MKIVIAGAGEVGYHLAHLLAEEAHDILLIDTDKVRLDYVEHNLDLMTVTGDSTSYSVLQQANISSADLLIAVTSSEATNLATAIIGKKLGARQTITRINNMEYLINKDVLDLKEVGIDELISPESLTAREIKYLLKDSLSTDSFVFENGKLIFTGVQIGEQSPLIGKSLAEAMADFTERKFVIVAISRGMEVIIPKGDTIFYPEDRLYFIAMEEGMPDILNLTGKDKQQIKKLMILGGSRTGRHLGRKLAGKYQIKLIEKDYEKCLQLADELPDVLVIHADGSDVRTLEEEGIADSDAFVAVTGNSEINIISSLVAKNHGVKKTIALVDNVEYLNLVQNIGITSLINKKVIAAAFIFRYIRKGDIVALTSIHGLDAEVLEFEVGKSCKITRKPIKELHFPGDVVIGGVIRDNKAIIPSGSLQIEPGDRVVVFVRTDAIHKVEKFFK